MAEQLWYDKYRPRSLDHYVWTDPKLKEQVTTWIDKRSLPSILLAGGPGRGKTTLAQLIIEQLQIDEGDVLRLKGAKDNNAETIRTRVQEFCELGGWSGLRVVFFDEADLLSRTAQEMLRTVIDDYSDSVRFIFTCNYPNRLIEPVASSRLIRIDIEKLPHDDFDERLLEIVQLEKINLGEPNGPGDRAFVEISDTCYPDLRKAINLLQHSVCDGALQSVHRIKSTTGDWDPYLRSAFSNRLNPLREVNRIREMLAALSPDEMEDVYTFLYHNGTSFFGDKQIKAIYLINGGQKSHRNALLPDMILLEVVIRLLVLLEDDD